MEESRQRVQRCDRDAPTPKIGEMAGDGSDAAVVVARERTTWVSVSASPHSIVV